MEMGLASVAHVEGEAQHLLAVEFHGLGPPGRGHHPVTDLEERFGQCGAFLNQRPNSRHIVFLRAGEGRQEKNHPDEGE